VVERALPGAGLLLALLVSACGGSASGPGGPSGGSGDEWAHDITVRMSSDARATADAAQPEADASLAGGDAGAGPGPVCDLGEQTCLDADTAGVCRGDRLGWTETACPDGERCLASLGRCATLACEPGASECVDLDTVLACESDGSGWRDPEPCPDGMICPGSRCVDVACVPAVVFLTDRSSSMSANWPLVWSSVAAITGQHPDLLYGLVPFPGSGGECTTGAGQGVGVSAGNAAVLDDWFDGHPATYRSTPLLATVQWLAAHVDDVWGRAKANGYLVVVSDGADSCACDTYSGTAQTDCVVSGLETAAGGLLDQGIRTYVIGYNYSDDPAELNALAENGGTPWTAYVPAGDEAALVDAFGLLLADLKLCLD
jgi:hypothetical protein